MNHILSSITYIRILRVCLNTNRNIKNWLLFLFWKFEKGAYFILMIRAYNGAASYYSILILNEQ